MILAQLWASAARSCLRSGRRDLCRWRRAGKSAAPAGAAARGDYPRVSSTFRRKAWISPSMLLGDDRIELRALGDQQAHALDLHVRDLRALAAALHVKSS